MAAKDLTVLRAQIVAAIATNTSKNITGDLLQTQLTDLLDSLQAMTPSLKTVGVLMADDFKPPATAYATPDVRNAIEVLDFDDTTAEAAISTRIMPYWAVLTGGLKVRIWWTATSATSGNVRWKAELERSNTDIDADSFDTAVEGTGATDATCGVPVCTEITLTTIDGIAAGDLFRLRITRLSTDTTNDTMAGDAELIGVELRSVA